MEATTIMIIAGISTLVIERAFVWANKIRRSECCGGFIKVETDCPETGGNLE